MKVKYSEQFANSIIEKYINVLIEKNLQVPKTLEILNRALSYNTYIDYVEENIL